MEHASIARKTGAWAAVAAVLVAGAFVADASAGAGGITEPLVIELVETGCSVDDDDPTTHCRVYPLTDDEGRTTGEILRFRVAVSDVDGNRVGHYHLQCHYAKSTGRTCSNVLTLKPGPYTERGTIVSMGANTMPPAAIVGGSGAYLNVRGEMWGRQQSDGFFHVFVKLIP
jgi:hypothetical protein